MLDTLLNCAVLSFRAPRKGARALLDMATGWESVALIFGLAFTVTAILTLFGSMIGGGEVAGEGLGFVATNLVFSVVAFAFSTGVVYGVGRMFGGRGELVEIAAVMAWHSLITSIFTPFISLQATMGAVGGPGAILQFFLMGVALWLLVNFITEAHRFESAWRVGAVMMGGVFVAGMLLSSLALASI